MFVLPWFSTPKIWVQFLELCFASIVVTATRAALSHCTMVFIPSTTTKRQSVWLTAIGRSYFTYSGHMLSPHIRVCMLSVLILYTYIPEHTCMSTYLYNVHEHGM